MMKLTILLAAFVCVYSRTQQVDSNVDYDNNVMWIDSLEYLYDTLSDAEMDDLTRHSGTYNFS